MNSLQVTILATALCTCVACVIPGTFLMLRGIALLSDAISHAVLPGIVIMFLLIGNLGSPALLLGAALSGVLTIFITESIIQTKRVKEDAAIGLVFPLFFSVGILLMNLYARNVHLDMDMVLLGELAFSPFNHCICYGINWGPTDIWIMAGIAIINGIFLLLFYKELIITTFDPILAHMLGFRPGLLYYGLIAVTSITAVGALNCVGSTIVVALMLIPSATAYLLTTRVQSLLCMSLLFSSAASVAGYTLATCVNVSIAGAIALMSGILFCIVFICAPHTGLYARYYRHKTEHQLLALSALCAYLERYPYQRFTHEELMHQLGWSAATTTTLLECAIKSGYCVHQDGCYGISPKGIQYILRIKDTYTFDQNLPTPFKFW